MMSTEQLDEIRERCEKATTGPWNKKEAVWYGEPRSLILDKEDTILAVMNNKDNLDFDFISHAREDIPALLDMINELHDRTGTYISMGAHLKLCSEFKRMKARCEYLESELRQSQGGPPDDIHPEYGFGK